MNLLSSQHTAKAILINLARYSDEKGKELSRFRMSRDSLRRVSNRRTLRASFVSDVIDAMAQLGWSCVNTETMTSDSELAFIQTPKIEAWPRLGVHRVIKIVRMKKGVDEIQEIIDDQYNMYYPEPEEDVLALED